MYPVKKDKENSTNNKLFKNQLKSKYQNEKSFNSKGVIFFIEKKLVKKVFRFVENCVSIIVGDNSFYFERVLVSLVWC